VLRAMSFSSSFFEGIERLRQRVSRREHTDGAGAIIATYQRVERLIERGESRPTTAGRHGLGAYGGYMTPGYTQPKRFKAASVGAA